MKNAVMLQTCHGEATMLRTVLASILLLSCSNLAFAHSKHDPGIRCFDDVDSLRKIYPSEHAYYVGLKKECWHVHLQNAPSDVKIAKVKPAKETKLAVSTKTTIYAETNEQLLRGYLGLDCGLWFPLPVVVCYTGR
jgi:hypothetical protein